MSTLDRMLAEPTRIKRDRELKVETSLDFDDKPRPWNRRESVACMRERTPLAQPWTPTETPLPAWMNDPSLLPKRPPGAK